MSSVFILRECLKTKMYRKIYDILKPTLMVLGYIKNKFLSKCV